MDREIKFRGLRVDNSEWAYGYYLYYKLSNRHYILTYDWQPSHSFLGKSSVSYLQGSHEVQPDTVGQYTGLKETCSGDIITFVPSDGSTKVKQKATILYDENRACFMADSNVWYIPLHKCQQIEIIGTIHEEKP